MTLYVIRQSTGQRYSVNIKARGQDLEGSLVLFAAKIIPAGLRKPYGSYQAESNHFRVIPQKSIDWEESSVTLSDSYAKGKEHFEHKAQNTWASRDRV